MTPRAAPPAPSNRTSRAPSVNPRLASRSLTRPTPSVLSPQIDSPSNPSVLTAPACSALSLASCAHRESLFLEGHGNVRPAAALVPERGERFPKVAGLHMAPGVDDVVAELAGKLTVNEGRLTVGHRVAHDHVGVDRLQCLAALSQTPSSLRFATRHSSPRSLGRLSPPQRALIVPETRATPGVSEKDESALRSRKTGRAGPPRRRRASGGRRHLWNARCAPPCEASSAAALERMDLVSREEFDVQQAVLERTRDKLERLERSVAELEARLDIPKGD